MSEYIITDMSLSAIATPNLQMIKHDGYIEMFCFESYLCDRYHKIVRCRECVYYEETGNCNWFKCSCGMLAEVTDDGFCSWGEQKKVDK